MGQFPVGDRDPLGEYWHAVHVEHYGAAAPAHGDGGRGIEKRRQLGIIAGGERDRMRSWRERRAVNIAPTMPAVCDYSTATRSTTPCRRQPAMPTRPPALSPSYTRWIKLLPRRALRGRVPSFPQFRHPHIGMTALMAAMSGCPDKSPRKRPSPSAFLDALARSPSVCASASIYASVPAWPSRGSTRPCETPAQPSGQTIPRGEHGHIASGVPRVSAYFVPLQRRAVA